MSRMFGSEGHETGAPTVEWQGARRRVLEALARARGAPPGSQASIGEGQAGHRPRERFGGIRATRAVAGQVPNERSSDLRCPGYSPLGLRNALPLPNPPGPSLHRHHDTKRRSTDGRGHVSGAAGGAEVSPRLPWLPAEQVGPGGGWDVSATVLGVPDLDVPKFLEPSSHCRSVHGGGVEEAGFGLWYQYSQAFSAAGADVEGLQFAALDTLQHGLAGRRRGRASRR